MLFRSLSGLSRQSQVLGRQGSVHGGDLIRHRQTAGRVRYLAGRVRCTGNQDTGTGTGTGTGDRRKPAGTTWETHKTNWHRTNITPLTKYPTNEQTRHTWNNHLNNCAQGHLIFTRPAGLQKTPALQQRPGLGNVK